MANNFNTINGGSLEWHTDSEDKPEYDKQVLYIYAYKLGYGNDNIADECRFTTQDFMANQETTKMIAWSYIDDIAPSELFKDWKEQEKNMKEKFRLERIAELEKELETLKKEIHE